jgi:hypothetical protein
MLLLIASVYEKHVKNITVPNPFARYRRRRQRYR